MKSLCENLLDELETQLSSITTKNPIENASQSVNLSVGTLKKLLEKSAKHRFKNKDEEIDFYRNCKPKFTAKVIYYRSLYLIALNKPPGLKKTVRQYYKSELLKLQHYFAMHQEFYRYYRSGNTTLDAFYFTQSGQETTSISHCGFIDAESTSNTPEHQVATILAHDALAIYLEHAIIQLASKETATAVKNTLNWTGPKVALVELVYGLHSSGVFNNGTAPLTEIANAVEAIFNVELGQFHRTFLEIRGRKSDRTKFLNSLRENLLTRMDEADEN